MNSRLNRAFMGALERSLRKRKTVGLLGWRQPDGSYRFDVPGRPGFVYVMLRLSSGAQTPTPAFNQPGLSHSPRMPVELEKDGDDYIIKGRSQRRDLAAIKSPNPSGVEDHIHPQHYKKSEHISTSDGAEDSGKPVVLDANGTLDLSLLDNTGIVETAAADSPEQTPLTTSDRFLMTVAGVLKWASYTTLRDAIKSYYDSVSATLTNKSIDASANTLTNINTSALANDAVSNAKLANVSQYTLKGRSTSGSGDPEDISSSAFFYSLLAAASAAAFRALTGAVGLTGNETIAGIKSFSDRANFNNALKTNGMYDFDYTTVSPAESKLKVSISRSVSTVQFQAIAVEIIMSCRVGTTTYMGMSTIIVQSRFSTTMVHGVGVQLAGLTVTEVTNTSILKELEVSFTGISGTITEIFVISLRKGSLNPNVTVSYTMLA